MGRSKIISLVLTKADWHKIKKLPWGEKESQVIMGIWKSKEKKMSYYQVMTILKSRFTSGYAMMETFNNIFRSFKGYPYRMIERRSYVRLAVIDNEI